MIDKDALTASSFFPKKSAREEKIVSDAVTSPPPAGYIPIRLTCSGGRLSAPALLHFRNYTFGESMELAEMRPEDEDATFARILTQMCWEKFPCDMLHREEIKEILLNIYATWWGKTLDIFYYRLDESKPLSVDNRSVASIPISAINFKELPIEFEEPIIAEDYETHTKVGFVLPRLINDIAAHAWIRSRYAEIDASFSDVRVALRTSGEDRPLAVGYDRLEAYEANERNKSADEIKALCSMQIFSINGKVLTDLDDKLEAISSKLSANFFNEFAKERRTRLRFGLDNKVTFMCSVKHEPIVRRFPFRLSSLIPTLDSPRDTRYSFSYGGKVSLDRGDDEADAS
jgi:hypothetical protein